MHLSQGGDACFGAALPCTASLRSTVASRRWCSASLGVHRVCRAQMDQRWSVGERGFVILPGGVGGPTKISSSARAWPGSVMLVSGGEAVLPMFDNHFLKEQHRDS